MGLQAVDLNTPNPEVEPPLTLALKTGGDERLVSAPRVTYLKSEWFIDPQPA